MSKKQNYRLSFKQICTIKHALQLQVQAKRINLSSSDGQEATLLRQDIEYEVNLLSVFASWEGELRQKYSIPKITGAEARELMGHDSFERRSGAIRQTRHGG